MSFVILSFSGHWFGLRFKDCDCKLMGSSAVAQSKNNKSTFHTKANERTVEQFLCVSVKKAYNIYIIIYIYYTLNSDAHEKTVQTVRSPKML